jgi:hypothetical protein
MYKKMGAVLNELDSVSSDNSPSPLVRFEANPAQVLENFKMK